MTTDKTAQTKRTYRRRPRCPHCGQPLTTAELGAMLSAMRTTHQGGAPRKAGAPRCPCGAMTLRRARARAHHCAPGAK